MRVIDPDQVCDATAVLADGAQVQRPPGARRARRRPPAEHPARAAPRGRPVRLRPRVRRRDERQRGVARPAAAARARHGAAHREGRLVRYRVTGGLTERLLDVVSAGSWARSRCTRTGTATPRTPLGPTAGAGPREPRRYGGSRGPRVRPRGRRRGGARSRRDGGDRRRRVLPRRRGGAALVHHNPRIAGEFARPGAIRRYLCRELHALVAAGATVTVRASRQALAFDDPRLLRRARRGPLRPPGEEAVPVRPGADGAVARPAVALHRHARGVLPAPRAVHQLRDARRGVPRALPGRRGPGRAGVQMPAWHHRGPAGDGVSLVNIGVGPPTRRRSPTTSPCCGPTR